MKKHFVKILSLVVAGALVLSACGGKSKETDTLIVVTPSLPPTLDPVAVNTQPASQVNVQIYETLILQQGRDAVLSPGLATSWEFVDAQTINLKLRQGVKFHNGEDFKASDVKFSLERAIESSHTRTIIGMVSDIIINNDHDVTIKLEYPFAPIISHLAHPVISMVSEVAVKASEAAGENYGDNPIGTGPFKFSEFVVGDKIELTRFEDYWGTKPTFNNMTFRMIPEATNRLIEVETGSAHIAYGVSATDIPAAEANANLNLVRDLNYSLTYLGFNTTKAPFDNPLVRQAIAHALDKDAIVKGVYHGAGKPAVAPINDNVWASNGALEAYEFNVERALELMKEAGLENGFSAKLWTNTGNAQRADLSEIIQNQLRAINIDVTVELMEFSVFTEKMSTPEEHEMFILGWGTTTNDPDYGLFNLFHSDSFGDAGNRMFWSSPQVDRLLEEGRRETNPDKRLQIYTEAQEIIHAELPWISVWQGEDLSVIGNNVRNFEHAPAGHHKLFPVSISE